MAIERHNAGQTSASMIETGLAPREIVNKRGLSPYENPNHVIANKGLRYLQDHVEKDSHYLSILDTRLSALLRHGWKIVPGATMEKGRLVVTEKDRKLAEFIQYALANLRGSFEADVMAMMTHISRGFSISEINYRYYQAGAWHGQLGLESIRFKEQEFYAFEFDALGHYELTQVDPEKRPLDLGKFVHLINGFNDENPYGESVAAICAFWVWLKENGAKYWSIYQERFGQPFAALEVPENASETERRLAEEIIAGVHESTGMLIPRNMVLKYIEAMRTGEANYRGFLEFANNEMSKAVLGSTLTVDTQKNASGSHALGQEHADVMGIKFSYDIITSQTAINQQLIRRLIDLNFPDVERYPRFQWNAVHSANFITFAQGIQALMRSGLRIPASWAHEVSGIPIAEDGEEVLEPSGGEVWPVAGVDNRVENRMAEGSVREIRGLERFGANTRKRAQQEMQANESLIARGTKELVSRWERFAKKCADLGKIDFEMCSEFEEREAVGILSQFLLISALRGVETALYEVQYGAYQKTAGAHELRELARVKREKPDHYSYYYKPFDEILKAFKKKRLVSRAEYAELERAAQREAFTVARADSSRVLQKIKAELDVVFAGRDTLPDYYAKVVELFGSAGMIGKGNHIETVLRTNLQTQYTDSRMKSFEGVDSEEFPFYVWEIVDDDATRDAHRALDGYTRRRDDPVWTWLRPPLDYNCRCSVRLAHVSEELAESDWIPERGDYEFTSRR